MFHKEIKTKHLMGFAVENDEKGNRVKVLIEDSLTSSDPKFSMYINQVFNLFLSKAGINYDCVSKFLIVLHKNDTADIYVNDFQEILKVKVNRSINKGEKVYQKDVSDIKEIKFPDIKISKEDVVIYFCKINWRYCLYFNFTRNVNQNKVQEGIGELVKELHIQDIEKRGSMKKPYFIDKNEKRVGQDKILVEGVIDKQYFEKFKKFFVSDLDFGIENIQDSNSSGGSQKLFNFFQTLVKSGHSGYKYFFVFDCDAKKEYEECKKIKTEWVIPFCWNYNEENNIIKRGIENLFEEKLFKHGENKKKRFFPKIIIDCGNKKTVKSNRDFNKKEFAKFICEERNRKEDFENFKLLVNFIKTNLK